MYSNGRIYVDTSVTPNVGVSIGDLQRCFAVVIKATINGQTVRRLSGDLGVICSKKTGDTFTVDGVTWRVESRAEINPWARYKPFPARLNGGNNVPTALTPTQRAAENYGINELVDMYTADNDSAFQDYVNGLDLDNQFGGISIRPWNSTDYWKRLTDFAKTDGSGHAVGNFGYDHNAQPGGFSMTTGGVTYQMSPLIPAGNRKLVIPPNSTDARFEFPRDSKWAVDYINLMLGNDTPTANKYITQNDEWLNPIDIFSGDTYSSIINATELRRGVMIFEKLTVSGVASWYLRGYCYDRDSSNTWGRDFAGHPNAFLDLTDTSTTEVFRRSGGLDLQTMEGTYLFLDIWTALFSSGSRTIAPIPGYCYEVTIYRSGSITVGIDIEGVLTFDSVTLFAGDSYVLRGHISYEYVHQLGESDDVRTVVSENYETLTLTVGSSTFNIKSSGYEHYISNDDQMALFEIVIPTAATTHPGTATMNGTRNNVGTLNAKTLTVYDG